MEVISNSESAFTIPRDSLGWLLPGSLPQYSGLILVYRLIRVGFNPEVGPRIQGLILLSLKVD